jgi:hypothetical protein
VPASRARAAHAPKRLDGEQGIAMIMVLVIMTVVMVIAAGLFSFAIASTTSIKTYKEDRTLRYAADGALEYGIANVTSNYQLGVTDGTGCSWNVPVEGRVTGDVTMSSGSSVRVSCAPYIVSTGADSDGGQKVRYVQFTVTCFNPVAATRAVNGKPSCSSSGSTSRILATAKVRYDFDTRSTVDVTKRAVVPKILGWDLQP